MGINSLWQIFPIWPSLIYNGILGLVREIFSPIFTHPKLFGGWELFGIFDFTRWWGKLGTFGIGVLAPFGAWALQNWGVQRVWSGQRGLPHTFSKNGRGVSRRGIFWENRAPHILGGGPPSEYGGLHKKSVVPRV